MHQIYPALSPEGGGAAGGAGGGARDTAELLVGLYAYPGGQDRPWVHANMIASVDGTATIRGRSGALGGPADRRLAHVLADDDYLFCRYVRAV